nr:hypothetical protein [Actinomadura madurae]
MTPTRRWPRPRRCSATSRAAEVVVAGDGGVPAGVPADEHERDPALGDLVQERGVGVRVAEDQPVDAAGQRQLGADPLLLRPVVAVHHEGRQAVPGGGVLDALVDRGEHQVGQPGDQHTDEVAARGAQAGGVRVRPVVQPGRPPPDLVGGLAGRGALRVLGGAVEHPGDGRDVDARRLRDGAQCRGPLPIGSGHPSCLSVAATP